MIGKAPARGIKKYPPKLLIDMFRKAAVFRNDMLKEGFTDNGGAIHSAERILNILGLTLKYPGLTHINNLRHFDNVEFSDAAWKLHKNGEKVLIEHVAPIRHFTQIAIDKIDKKISDAQFKAFVKRYYRLVLLSPEETSWLNSNNRSTVSLTRLTDVGIRVKKRRRLTARA